MHVITRSRRKIVGKLYVLYYNQDIGEVMTLANAGGTGTTLDNWVNNYANVAPYYFGEKIAVSPTQNIFILGSDSDTGNGVLARSSDNGLTFSIVIDIDATPYGIVFDKNNPSVGWVLFVGNVGNAAKAALAGSVTLDGEYTFAEIEAACDYFANYGDITLYVTVDSGANWTPLLLDYSLQLAPSRLVGTRTVGGGAAHGQLGIESNDIINLDPSHTTYYPDSIYDNFCSWTIDGGANDPRVTSPFLLLNASDIPPVTGRNMQQDDNGGSPLPPTVLFYQACDLTSLQDYTKYAVISAPFIGGNWGAHLVAPSWDGTFSYVIIPLDYKDKYIHYSDYDLLAAPVELYNTAGATQHTLGTNFIYKVSTSAVVGRKEINSADYDTLYDANNFFVSLQVDPLDDDRIFVLTEQMWLGKISWASGVFTRLTEPWTPASSNTWQITITKLGTLIVPIDAGGTLIIYVGTSVGTSWTSFDTGQYATAQLMGVSTDGTISITLDDGSVLYSVDDGVSWLQTAVILPADSVSSLDGR